MKFEKYHISPEIKKSLRELEFKKPTDIQFKSIPPILKGDDVLAIAQTGTGKTAAFAIPVLSTLQNRVRKNDTGQIRAVVMVPTRELAVQITDVFKSIGKYSGLEILTVMGGVEQAAQIDQLQKGVDVLIATPGRVFDLVNQGHINLRQLEILILDEADHMLDKGFIKDIRDLIRFLPRKRQTLFFSATINETIKELAYSLVHKPVRIQISPKDPVSKNVEHAVAFVDMDDKRFYLERLIKQYPDKKILVFVRTKVRAERVFSAMGRVGLDTATMHGDKEQDDRLAVMEQFKSGEVNVLIATDVSARGIDIAGVEYVINYDLPDVAENYIHRIGRTGRGRSKGQAVSFCSEEEKPMLAEIEALLDKEVRRMEIKKSEHLETLAISEEIPNDWRSVLKEIENQENFKPKKKKR
ncbi:DEAD/DEAH box helicase [Solitalea koreensis]|nr:DEAD/DEAH box helicase [Solitalea koreensis]